jgi:hypothetical protein
VVHPRQGHRPQRILSIDAEVSPVTGTQYWPLQQKQVVTVRQTAELNRSVRCPRCPEVAVREAAPRMGSSLGRAGHLRMVTKPTRADSHARFAACSSTTGHSS